MMPFIFSIVWMFLFPLSILLSSFYPLYIDLITVFLIIYSLITFFLVKTKDGTIFSFFPSVFCFISILLSFSDSSKINISFFSCSVLIVLGNISLASRDNGDSVLRKVKSNSEALSARLNLEHAANSLDQIPLKYSDLVDLMRSNNDFNDIIVYEVERTLYKKKISELYKRKPYLYDGIFFRQFYADSSIVIADSLEIQNFLKKYLKKLESDNDTCESMIDEIKNNNNLCQTMVLKAKNKYPQ